MCLNLITKTFNPPDPKVRKGWKFVEEKNGKLYSIYQETEYLEGWQIALKGYGDDWKLGALNDYQYANRDERPQYAVGFHVFTTRDEARKAKRILSAKESGVFCARSSAGKIRLVQVEVKDVRTEGTDATAISEEYRAANIKTLVADYMRIVRVVKD